MAGALRKTMLYLGLSEPEPEYDAATEDGQEMELDHHHDHEAYAVEPVDSGQVMPLHGDSALRRITTVHPRAYNDAKVIGEAFRSGTPVIINLTEMSDAEAKRLVDFSAGLVFGLRGSIERVTNKVFLLSPASVEVAAESSEPEVTGARFFNQS